MGVVAGAAGDRRLLGHRNIDVGTKVLAVLLTLEVAVVAVLAVAVLVQGGADGLNLRPFTFGAFFDGAPGISIMFAIASFVGFEATAIYGEEARDPSAPCRGRPTPPSC